eukprot:PhF_6_TR4881/c0_g1_i1/m.6873
MICVYLLFLLSLYDVVNSQSASCRVVTQTTSCGALICNETTSRCEMCTNNEQCDNDILVCMDGDCLLEPIGAESSWKVFATPTIALMICSVAAVGGMGGGGVLVAAFVAFGYPVMYAIPLTQYTIVGQAGFNMLMNFKKPSPKGTMTLIHWDIVVLLLPVIVAGATIGDLLGRVSPDWLRLLTLFFVLVYMGYRTVRRAKKQHAKDAAAKVSSDMAAAAVAAAEENTEDVEMEEFGDDGVPLPPPNQPTCVGVPWSRVVYSIVMWLFVACMTALKSRRLGITQCGSAAYWGAVSYTIIVTAITSLSIGIHFYSKAAEAVAAGEPPHPEDITWNVRNAFFFPSIAVFAGLASSLLGIGGGMVLVVILFEMGVHPTQSSATSAVATFYASLTNTVIYTVNDSVGFEYIIMYVSVGVVSSVLGQLLIMNWITRKGYNYMILYIVAGVIIVSLVTLSLVTILSLVKTVNRHGSMGFVPLCKNH